MIFVAGGRENDEALEKRTEILSLVVKVNLVLKSIKLVEGFCW